MAAAKEDVNKEVRAMRYVFYLCSFSILFAVNLGLTAQHALAQTEDDRYHIYFNFEGGWQSVEYERH